MPAGNEGPDVVLSPTKANRRQRRDAKLPVRNPIRIAESPKGSRMTLHTAQSAAPAQPAAALTFPAAGGAGFRHAAELARLLVRHLGVDGAAKTCRENHWDGVLSEVMRQASASSTP